MSLAAVAASAYYTAFFIFSTRASPGAGTIISQIDQQLRQAEQYYAQGQVAEAEVQFRAAMESDPANRPAREALVVICLQAGRREEARDLLLALVADNPDEAMYYDRLNLVCEALGEPDAAITAYRELLQRQPDQTTSRYNLAHLLKRSDQLDEAIAEYNECLQRGVENPAEVLTNLSVIHTQRGADELARQCLAQALELREDYVPALYNKAILEEETGNWDIARSLYMRVLLEEPDNVDAMVQLANGDSFDDPTNRVVRKMVRAMKRDNLMPLQRERVLYALGKVYDDCGQYEDAMVHYSRANELSRDRSQAHDPEAHARRIQQLMTDSPAWLENIEPVSEAPLIFICGMFRSGSTLLEQILAAHPQLEAGGEIDFFPREVAAMEGDYPANLGGLGADSWQALGHSYLDYLQERGLDPASATNKRPDNFLYLGLIKALFPRARILHTVRNPLDTCLSIFFQPFEGQLDYANDMKHIADYYLQYRRLMNFYGATYPGEILHVPYDVLVSDPETVIRSVLDFLTLDWDDACLRFYDTDSRVRTASVHQVRKPLYRSSSGRADNYAERLQPVREYLDEEIAAL